MDQLGFGESTQLHGIYDSTTLQSLEMRIASVWKAMIPVCEEHAPIRNAIQVQVEAF